MRILGAVQIITLLRVGEDAHLEFFYTIKLRDAMLFQNPFSTFSSGHDIFA